MGATATVCQAGEQVPVSIHAPVWVRRQKDDIVLYRIGFNSRTRVGATPVPVILLISGLVSIHAPVWVRRICFRGCPLVLGFQFTHPCGCDFIPYGPGKSTGGFNSRTRVGATGGDCPGDVGADVSIHAPVWVRLSPCYGISPIYGFQFTHPCGCDGLTNTV